MSKAQGHKDFGKPSEHCHADVHCIALAGYSQISTCAPGFQSFFMVFASFFTDQISHKQHKDKMIFVQNYKTQLKDSF